MGRTPDKLDKLDNAFLFTISLVGLFFTIVQVYVKQIEGLIVMSPLLVLGVVLPFYIGYVRGAITFDSQIVERARGWVYFIMGIGAYCTFVFPSFIWIGFSLLILPLLLASWFIFYLEKWFKNTFNLQENARNLSALSGTLASSFCFAYFAAFVSVILTQGISNFQVFTSLTELAVASFSFLAFARLEKLVRLVLNERVKLQKMNILNEQITFFDFIFRYSLSMVWHIAIPVSRRDFELIIIGVMSFFIGSALPVQASIVSIFLLSISIGCFILDATIFLRLSEVNYIKLVSRIQKYSLRRNRDTSSRGN